MLVHFNRDLDHTPQHKTLSCLHEGLCDIWIAEPQILVSPLEMEMEMERKRERVCARACVRACEYARVCGGGRRAVVPAALCISANPGFSSTPTQPPQQRFNSSLHAISRKRWVTTG